ncbi:winged helix-turn-helix transcriptional regulator [Natranaeroarchaeum sulfidigenes]|uniref:DNA-binding transcriptional regulator, HxlR family n=1 Tax=Natranaeroarchaeum sulfidigenes TaxID=2784880 RepID=A0A897MUY0_9EURY|nr:helix-turn-helix domain-containing protein [Natranaeroarchaeum sulfidigenes]QSG03828.1 DNA-binding transcriptional regulator, HxlR family [Natranaeroarchaeum sulfidigenes]
MSGNNGPPADHEPRGRTTSEDIRARRESLSEDDRAAVEETVAELLDVLGKTHAMAVLSEFAVAEEPLRFSDLQSTLDVPPNTLSTRLSELTEAGLLVRESHDEVPPRVVYEPTEKAEGLFPAFGYLHEWAIEQATDR